LHALTGLAQQEAKRGRALASERRRHRAREVSGPAVHHRELRRPRLHIILAAPPPSFSTLLPPFLQLPPTRRPPRRPTPDTRHPSRTPHLLRFARAPASQFITSRRAPAPTTATTATSSPLSALLLVVCPSRLLAARAIPPARPATRPLGTLRPPPPWPPISSFHLQSHDRGVSPILQQAKI